MKFLGIVIIIGILWFCASQANKPITAKRGEKLMGAHYMIDARYKQKSDRATWNFFFWVVLIGTILGIIQSSGN